MKGFLILFFLLSHSIPPALAGTEPYYHAVPAKPGDGILTLLNRYELDEHRCNVDKFLELNQLKAEDHLLEGQAYKLPVLIYAYNGKSIRTTLGITDYEKAKRIANYNRAILNRNLRQTDYESSRILWVPHHELNCGTDTKPQPVKEISISSESKLVSTSSIDATSIFGEAYGNVVVKSDKLRGKVYYISSGHGGPDPGAVAKIGNNAICEDEYAYDVALRLSRNLMENGATVYIVVQDKNDGIRNDDILICDQDELTMGKEDMPVNQLQRLRQRTDAINEIYGRHAREGAKEQVLVCIHVDSRSASHRQDVFFYHFEHSKSGKKLAHNMQDVFESKYARYRPGGEYHGTVSCRNLYMLRMPYPTTLYVELANIKNEYDRKRILPSTNRQALANWLYEGLVK
jgi:N-acetylmuramoyl-L-alanine amidase